MSETRSRRGDADPVNIGGIGLEPGDFLRGDGDGIVVISQRRVEETLAIAEEIHEGQKRIRAALETGARLRDARQRRLSRTANEEERNMSEGRRTPKQSKPNRVPADPRATSSLDTKLGEKLRSIREEAGLSQVALAEQVGVTFQQVQKYERGANRISVARLAKIAKALDVPVKEFFAVMGAEVGPRKTDSRLASSNAEMLALFGQIRDQSVRRRVITLVRSLTE